MKHSRTQGLASITGLTLVLGACSGDGYENEDNGAPLLDSHKQEILNGQTSNLDNVVKVYRRKASGSGLCTGTLLRNDIVLTAAHCVGTADGGNFRRHWITTPGGGSSDISSLAQIKEHPDVDMAVMKLDRKVAFGGSSDYSMTPLYTGSAGSLVNKNVLCAGYGVKTCGGSDSGTQRSAGLVVKGASSTSLSYDKNTLDQMLSKGDSGGPCFLNGAVVGTTRTVTCSSARQTPVPANLQWIRQQIATLLGTQEFQSPTVSTSLALYTPIRRFVNDTTYRKEFCIEKGYADADSEYAHQSAPAGTVAANWNASTGTWQAQSINLPIGIYTKIVCRN